MRRIGVLLLVAVAAVVLAGCSGAGAERAQQLLQQSDQALKELKSYRFAGRLSIESDGTEYTFVLKGGGNTRRGGASYLTMRGENVPGFPAMTVVQQGDRVWIGAGGSWTQTQAPAGQPSGLDQFDLSQYVKDVSVDEGATVDSEPAVKLSGVLDTPAMFEAILGGLGDVSGTGVSVDEVTDMLGDIRVVLYVSDVSHLPVRTLVDMPLEAQGKKVEMHFDFALEPAKRPVRVPVPVA